MRTVRPSALHVPCGIDATSSSGIAHLPRSHSRTVGAEIHPPYSICAVAPVDVTGLNALSEHRNHPLVAASGYFYIHDTCLFHPGFAFFWEKLKLRETFANPYTVLSSPLPLTSNIFAFGPGVLGRIGSAFSKNITKLEAQALEQNGESLVNAKFGGNVTWMQRRQARARVASRPLPPRLLSACATRSGLLRRRLCSVARTNISNGDNHPPPPFWLPFYPPARRHAVRLRGSG